jgi:hypothetical protein
MSGSPNPKLYWILAALLLILLASWKFMLPTNTPTAVAPAGKAPRMADAP